MPALTVQIDPFSPVTLAEAKGWAKANLNASPEDDLLTLLINSAFENVEKEIDLEIVSRGTITELHTILNLNQWEIWTLQTPIHTFTSLKNDSGRDFSNPNADLPAAERIVDMERGKISRMGAGSSHPTPFIYGLDTVQVVYSAGYQNPTTNLPAAAAPVPNSLKSCILETIASYYYHITEQGFNVTGNSDDQGNRSFVSFDFIPKPVRGKLSQFKPIRVGRIRARRDSVV